MKTKIRILSAVKHKYPHLSQKQIKKLLDENKVHVGKRMAKRNEWIKESDAIVIPKPFLTQSLPANENVDCQLIKKTHDYIFFHKGACVHSVAHDFQESDTAANWLLCIDDKLYAVSKPLESGLAHRLDYETPGVMVAARNQVSFAWLKDLFQKQKVYKEYVCLVSDEPPEVGVYFAHVGKKLGTSKRTHIQIKENKKKRLRKIKTEILFSKRLARNKYLIRIRLISGFRHQIRAHLGLLRCPIVGDKLYGGIAAKELKLQACQLGFEDEKGKSILIKDKEIY